jgi:RNA-directed DNA polymerase
LCKSRQQAEDALAWLRLFLAELGLEPKAAKTRIVHLQVGGEGFDCLGFHHRLVSSQGHIGAKGVTFLARWPSRRAMQHARDQVRDLTARRRLRHSVEWIVEDLNRFLRGWAAYFRYGNSTDQFDKINRYAPMRMALFIAKRHRRSCSFGWYVVAYASPNQLGLIKLTHRMPAVNNVGEPCAGEPHARFDGRGLETGAHVLPHRASPRPYLDVGRKGTLTFLVSR